MKKIFALMLSGIFIFGLGACGLENEEDDPNDDEPGEEDVLRVGMDLSYPPFETQTDGEAEGISVDVANEFGEFLGREVEIVDTNFGSLIPALNTGDIDIIIASMSITEGRAESVDFSDPYFYFKIISLLNQDFADEHDLHEESSTEDILAIEDAKYVGLADQVSYQIPRDKGLDVVESTDLPSAIFDITQGVRDILMMSAFPVSNNQQANPDTTMIVYDPFVVSPIGMAVRQGESELLEEANAFIAQMDEEDGVYDRLRETWNDDINERLGRYDLDFFIYED